MICKNRNGFDLLNSLPVALLRQKGQDDTALGFAVSPRAVISYIRGCFAGGGVAEKACFYGLRH